MEFIDENLVKYDGGGRICGDDGKRKTLRIYPVAGQGSIWEYFFSHDGDPGLVTKHNYHAVWNALQENG